MANRPKLDIRYLLNPFYIAINNYFSNGDTRDLANLVKNQPIPEPFRETIALILTGDLRHNKASKSLAKSFHIIKQYNRYQAMQKYIHYDGIVACVEGGLLPPDRLKGLKKYNYSKRQVIEQIASEFYKNDYETARRTIDRLVKKHNLPKLGE